MIESAAGVDGTYECHLMPALPEMLASENQQLNYSALLE